MVHHTMKPSKPSASSASTMISHMTRHSRQLAWLAALALAACTTAPRQPPPAPPPAPSVPTVTRAVYELQSPDALPPVSDAELRAAWPAWLTSCRTLARRAPWQAACERAAGVTADDPAALRRYASETFDAYRIRAETRESAPPAGTEARTLGVANEGRMTGYYEPELLGSRTRSAPFVVPLHRAPEDLVTVELGSLYPELKNQRVRGRLETPPQGARRVVPYWSRAELESGERLQGKEIVWVDNAVEAFFLQIQGSGRVRLPDNSVIRVGYADQNGHPYRSVGRWLVDRGELPLEHASLQGIRAWTERNPQRLSELLNQNPSYVFFRELPLGDPRAGPLGAMGLPLTAGYSVAVDPQFVPLGAPLLIRTTHPTDRSEIVRWMLAQDTGGAIRGPLRFDFYWGTGSGAGEQAGRQRGDAAAWLLVPKGVRPEALLSR
jgi:membrane-bound lytic murein transglycosylase A